MRILENPTRRQFIMALPAPILALAGSWRSATDAADATPPKVETSKGSPVRSIERSILREGRHGPVTWFMPRACQVPGKPPSILMTIQQITYSDVYGPVHWTETHDLGKTWTDFQPIPGMERKQLDRDLKRGDLEVGICDVVPNYHAATQTVLAIGSHVFYRKDRKVKDPPQQRPAYVIRDKAGHWAEPRSLTWDDPRGAQIVSCGSSQRATCDNGDILLPISFGPKTGVPRSAATVRCTFDGRELAIREIGRELRNERGRGLIEPSMIRFSGRYYLTLRAEDGRGYVAVSDDGMQWSDAAPWSWNDDGKPLGMSTTQQHWLVHAGELFLIYTRRSENNAGVFRWRAPLYMAKVDPQTLRLVRDSEQIVFPMIEDPTGDQAHIAGMGNPYPMNVSDQESWVMTGEERSRDGYHGDLLLARIRWSKP